MAGRAADYRAISVMMTASAMRVTVRNLTLFRFANGNNFDFKVERTARQWMIEININHLRANLHHRHATYAVFSFECSFLAYAKLCRLIEVLFRDALRPVFTTGTVAVGRRDDYAELLANAPLKQGLIKSANNVGVPLQYGHRLFRRGLLHQLAILIKKSIAERDHTVG